MKTFLKDYVNYNYWANKKLCDLLVTLDDTILEKEIPSSFKTIKDTLFHYWDAQVIWVDRINGIPIKGWPSENFKGSFKDAVDEILKQSESLIALIESKSDEELTQTIEYKNQQGTVFKNTLYEIIMHCMNHSTFHRGQIITMLRLAGVTNLFSTDLITYYRQR
jgi:uncharacterized damage-inducible protein DinB